MAWLTFLALAQVARLPAAEDYERAPISYWQVEPSDAVSKLKRRLESGEFKVDRRDEKALLKAVLKELEVPASSQVLVFSKTSLQRNRIGPETPRAIYFSDNIYVGWVPGGSIEMSCFDVRLGPTFYLLELNQDKSPPLVTRPQECLNCHAGTMSQGVPGFMVRSVYPDASGNPILAAGTKLTDHSSPILERWGGWYVTGLHDSMRHRGNVIASASAGTADLDMEKGANLKSLEELFDTSRYLLDQSDIVALLVLEHQVGMHNRLAHGGYTVRLALHRQEAFGREVGIANGREFSESTQSLLNSEAESIVRYMLFSDEFPMASEGVTSTSSFADDFQASGRRDSSGQSLKSFHLGKRLFRNRCSYMIYSAAFDALPPPLIAAVSYLLRDALTGSDSRKLAVHLSADERTRLCRILRETKPTLAQF